MDTLRLRETCWQVIDGPSGRLVVCAIYQTAGAGLELRVGYATNDILRSERAADQESARALADQWLSGFRAAGSIASTNQP